MSPRIARAAAIAAAIALLVGCAAAPIPAPPVEPDDGWVEVQTQNGSATFRIPPTWRISDRSGLQPEEFAGWPNLPNQWVNEIAVFDAEGQQQLRYLDTPSDLTSRDMLEPGETRVLDERSIAGGLSVRSAWHAGEGCGLLCRTFYTVHLDVVDASGHTVLVTGPPENIRYHAFGYATLDGVEAEDSAAAAEQVLVGETGQAVTAVLSTLELADVGADALPPGVVAPTEEPATLPWTTDNGSARMTIPGSWRSSDIGSVEGSQYFTMSTFSTQDSIEWAGYREWSGTQLPLAHTEPSAFEVVDAAPTADGFSATAWWQTADDGTVLAGVALTESLVEGEPPTPRVALDNDDAVDLYLIGDPEGFAATDGGPSTVGGRWAHTFPSVAAAEAFLTSEQARDALTAFSTYDLHGTFGALP